MRNTIIHIGANKTASTTLQRALFSKSNHLQYIGEDGIGYPDYANALNSLIYDDDLYYQKEECKKLFENNLASREDKTLVFSSEDVLTSTVPVACAKRLHSFLPNAKVLLVTRNQFTAVPSFYANHGAFLKPAPPSYFRRHVSLQEWISFQEIFIKYGALASFKYNTLVSIYENLFGADNIHILLFEEFQQDKKKFAEKLGDLLKIEVKEILEALEGRHERKRYTGRMLTYNHFRTNFFWGVKFSKFIPFGNPLVRKFYGFLEQGTAAKIPLNDEIKKKISGLYAVENSELDQKYHLNLAKYGYPMIKTNSKEQASGDKYEF
ncbi:hypothetical protein EHQ58_08430 [Leptospira ognonensis]|uniref:Sulfotransferase domain-containing protein n=1 Tax=Leptospira ognonensis TaxID=2484945 RepID=A0A4R9K633_9LEPT|nr:sulfotransferase domain-containing protein [Leptospira ognonensis]TGL59757.1 hypothetical protein EHQ58_08430 [Leptospira ognonensis]